MRCWSHANPEGSQTLGADPVRFAQALLGDVVGETSNLYNDILKYSVVAVI